MKYLEEKALYLTKITRDDKKINKEAEMVLNSKEEMKSKKALYKKKKDI